jgi:hypothetical protein
VARRVGTTVYNTMSLVIDQLKKRNSMPINVKNCVQEELFIARQCGTHICDADAHVNECESEEHKWYTDESRHGANEWIGTRICASPPFSQRATHGYAQNARRDGNATKYQSDTAHCGCVGTMCDRTWPYRR